MASSALTEQQRIELKEYRNSISNKPPSVRAMLMREKRAEFQNGTNGAEKVQEATKAVIPVPETDVSVQAPKRRVMPHGELTWVTCDLAGWEGTEIGYDLQARWAVQQGIQRDDDGLGTVRRVMVLAPEYRNMPIDPLTEQPFAPVYGELETYLAMCTRAVPFVTWVISQGQAKALEQIAKN